METLEALSLTFVNAVWSTPLVLLLLGGGLFFAIYSRGLPYRHLGHAVGIMLGRYDQPDEQGELSHGQALAAALSGTMGLGNISGVMRNLRAPSRRSGAGPSTSAGSSSSSS